MLPLPHQISLHLSLEAELLLRVAAGTGPSLELGGVSVVDVETLIYDISFVSTRRRSGEFTVGGLEETLTLRIRESLLS